MANRTKRTPTKDGAFFEALSAGMPVKEALAAAGYKRTTVYERRKLDPDFAQRWTEAIEEAVERMEAEADRRAIEGTLRPVYYQGTECGQIREFSDTLLIFRLKALRPDKYRDRASFEHSGPDGGPIPTAPTVDLSGFTNDELNQLRELAARLGDGTGES